MIESRIPMVACFICAFVTGCGHSEEPVHPESSYYNPYYPPKPVVERPPDPVEQLNKDTAFDWDYMGEPLVASRAYFHAVGEGADPTTRPETKTRHSTKAGDLEYQIVHVWTASNINTMNLGMTPVGRDITTRRYVLVTVETRNAGRVPLPVPQPCLISSSGSTYDAAQEGFLAEDSSNGLRRINPGETLVLTAAFSLAQPLMPGDVSDKSIAVGVDGRKVISIPLR